MKQNPVFKDRALAKRLPEPVRSCFVLPLRRTNMTDEQPTPWVHGSDDDIVFTIAHALRHEGRKVTRQAGPACRSGGR
jgi:hypothetical protein